MPAGLAARRPSTSPAQARWPRPSCAGRWCRDAAACRAAAAGDRRRALSIEISVLEKDGADVEISDARVLPVADRQILIDGAVARSLFVARDRWAEFRAAGSSSPAGALRDRRRRHRCRSRPAPPSGSAAAKYCWFRSAPLRPWDAVRQLRRDRDARGRFQSCRR